MLDYEFHLIVTMRTRTTYEVERDEKGKTRIQKMGTKPKQREGLEYEFTTVLDLQLPYHLAETSKDRTGFLDQRPPFALDEELGEKLVAWLGRGAAPAQRSQPPRQPNGDQRSQGDNGEPDELRQLYDQFLADGGHDETWRQICSGVGISRATRDDQVKLEALRSELEAWRQSPDSEPGDDLGPDTPAPANDTDQGEVLKMVRVMVGDPDLQRLDHLSLAEVKVVLGKIDDRIGGRARQFSLGR